MRWQWRCFFTITEKPVDSQACVLYNSLRTEGRSELIIKVSVIIPVYNAESFLRPCLNSVISQNYKDSEIILIENGSEDGSRTICEEYAERFENIRIITETQRGTAMARQRGLDVCKGEAVVFVDADDVLPSPDVFSKMAECLEKTEGRYCLWRIFQIMGRKTSSGKVC